MLNNNVQPEAMAKRGRPLPHEAAKIQVLILIFLGEPSLFLNFQEAKHAVNQPTRSSDHIRKQQANKKIKWL